MQAEKRNQGIAEESVDTRMAMRARRVSGAKKKKRIRMRVLLSLGLLLLIGGGLWVVYWSPFFDVDRIRFSGIAYASKERMSGITEELKGDPMASVDIESASDRIKELPWVKEVKINRSWWGGEMSIEILERTPVAVQAVTDGYELLGREGKILQKVADTGGFPVIEGVANAEGWVKEAEPALEAAEQLSGSQDLAAQVRAIVVAESGDVFFNLKEGGWIRVGDSRELPNKLRSVRTVLQEVGVRCDQMLDVRSPLVPAMTSGHNCQV